MEYFPEIEEAVPVVIPALPYLGDHIFENRPVLPAVEACEYIARTLRGVYPEININSISSGKFERFLPLPDPMEPLPCICRLRTLKNGLVEGALLTRKTGKKSGISRSLEHAAMIFGEKSPFPEQEVHENGGGFEISPRKIYEELVMFGPCYHTVRELTLSEERADAVIGSPETDPGNILGSPFILDGAFHAACVWAQRFCSCVPFPVGFGHRSILRKTEGGRSYRVRVIPMGKQGDLLNFNIWILDGEDLPHEHIRGLRMMDLSRGRLRPPAWITGNLSP